MLSFAMVLAAIIPAAPGHADDQPLFPIAHAATLKSRALLEDRPWTVSVFGGYLFSTTFIETYRSPSRVKLQDDAVVGGLVQRRVARLLPHLDLELEGGLIYRTTEALWEIHGLIVLRWDYFPWNDFVYTTFAVATGPSYTFGLSQQEKLRSDDGRTSMFLNNFSPEITFALPDKPHLMLFIRHHRRSAVFGAIKGLNVSIDYGVVGFRLRF
jgi:hypothetical protein